MITYQSTRGSSKKLSFEDIILSGVADDKGLYLPTSTTLENLSYLTQEDLTYEDLKNADEAFFTGTAVEITPITKLDQSNISDGKRGPITSILQDTFLSIVSGQNSKYSHWLTYTS